MSWSTTAIGKPAAVAAKVKEDIERYKCAEPEESIKNSIGQSIYAALACFPEGTAVRVEASGSQYVPDASKPDAAINTLNVKIEPLYGFIE